MKSKPNIDAFLEGGAASEKEGVTVVESRPARAARAAPALGIPSEFRKQMVMQLPIALINDLKRRALDESVRLGKRVTQQQLVEEALKTYLYK